MLILHRQCAGFGGEQVMSLLAAKTTAVVAVLMFPLLLTACSHAPNLLLRR